MRRIEPVKIARPVRFLVTLIDPDFFEWLFAWWHEVKGTPGRHAPRVHVEFIAHPDELIPVHKPAAPAPRTFRRKRSGV